MSRIVVALIVTSILTGCAALLPNAKSAHRQGVAGMVWFKPGYDASIIEYYISPPDTAVRPLPGAIVYLLKFSDIGPNSRAMIDSVRTDILGHYEIVFSPGKYYLAVKAPHIPSVIRAFTPNTAVGLDFEVNDLVVIEIRPGKITERSFEIYELVPQ